MLCFLFSDSFEAVIQRASLFTNTNRPTFSYVVIGLDSSLERKQRGTLVFSCNLCSAYAFDITFNSFQVMLHSIPLHLLK